MACTETWPNRRVGALCMALLLALASWCLADTGPEAAVDVPRRDLELVLGNALGFLRSQQLDTGAFGTVQPNLQTGLAVLAILSMNQHLPDEDLARVEKAVGYMTRAGEGGDLGDEEFATESHAIATTALLCALARVKDADLRAQGYETARRALRHLVRTQDRSSSGRARGGWRMEGAEGRGNDRRASAWALLAYDTARRYGIDVDPTRLGNGVRYMLGSLKTTLGEGESEDMLSGFSAGEEGLPVPLISSMGGWVLARFDGKASERESNLAWLRRHPAEWRGPNYFYTNFFRVRTVLATSPGSTQDHRLRRLLFLHVKENQLGDGQVRVPPGNAQNTVAMAPTFSTAMAILILRAESGTLVFDRDAAAAPLF